MAGAFLAIARSFFERARHRLVGGAGAGPNRSRPARRLRDCGIVLVVIVAGFVPNVFAGDMDPLQRAVCAAGVGVFGILFVAVAARSSGLSGSPRSPFPE